MGFKQYIFQGFEFRAHTFQIPQTHIRMVEYTRIDPGTVIFGGRIADLVGQNTGSTVDDGAVDDAAYFAVTYRAVIAFQRSKSFRAEPCTGGAYIFIDHFHTAHDCRDGADKCSVGKRVRIKVKNVYIAVAIVFADTAVGTAIRTYDRVVRVGFAQHLVNFTQFTAEISTAGLVVQIPAEKCRMFADFIDQFMHTLPRRIAHTRLIAFAVFRKAEKSDTGLVIRVHDDFKIVPLRLIQYLTDALHGKAVEHVKVQCIVRTFFQQTEQLFFVSSTDKTPGEEGFAVEYDFPVFAQINGIARFRRCYNADFFGKFAG